MRSGAKVAVVGGVFVLVAGGVGYAAYDTLGATGAAATMSPPETPRPR